LNITVSIGNKNIPLKCKRFKRDKEIFEYDLSEIKSIEDSIKKKKIVKFAQKSRHLRNRGLEIAKKLSDNYNHDVLLIMVSKSRGNVYGYMSENYKQRYKPNIPCVYSSTADILLKKKLKKQKSGSIEALKFPIQTKEELISKIRNIMDD